MVFYDDDGVCTVNSVGRTATEIAADVRAGVLTARQVAEEHIAHATAVADRLGAVVSFDPAVALAGADVVDASENLRAGALAGVPIVVSDTLHVAGLPTRYGSSAKAHTPESTDDPVVAALRAAGAVIIAKTRVSELGIWGTADDPDGIAVSPWDPTRSAGGSSGGAAACVSAAVAPVGIGVDVNGSVRGPAAACGVVGLRLASVLAGGDCVGVLATSTSDAKAVAAVLEEPATTTEPAKPEKHLRVAVSWKPPAPGVVVSAAWREAAIEAGRLLHRDGEIVAHVDPPYDRGATQAGVARWTHAASQLFTRTQLEEEELQGRTRAHIAAGERLNRVSRITNGETDKWRERSNAFFEDTDLVVTPAFARVQPAASAWHNRPWAANIAAELSAYPFFAVWENLEVTVCVVPLWHDGGRPLAVQLVSRSSAALTVAERLEKTVPWARHAPGWTVGA